MPRRIIAILIACGLVGFTGCSSPEAPVAAVAVTPTDFELPHSAFRKVTLEWRMRRELAGLEGEPRVLVHLVDRGGDLLRTFDHPFPGGWTTDGDERYDLVVFQSALGPPLEPGDYGLIVGLYDQAGHRWPVEVATSRGGGGRRAATVRAVTPPAGFPQFSFSASWMPIEEGTDLQIPARRWATGDAAIRVGGLAEEGSVWLRIGLPDGADPGQDLVLEEGANQLRATVSADCSDFEAELEGVGSWPLEVPLPAAAEGCQIDIRANFELISRDNQERRTVVLENLAWSVGF